MSGYPEFFNIIYRDDQRIMVLNENPEKKVKVVKRKVNRNMVEEADTEPKFKWTYVINQSQKNYWFVK
jgi:hypothetical protein